MHRAVSSLPRKGACRCARSPSAGSAPGPAGRGRAASDDTVGFGCRRAFDSDVHLPRSASRGVRGPLEHDATGPCRLRRSRGPR